MFQKKKRVAPAVLHSRFRLKTGFHFSFLGLKVDVTRDDSQQRFLAQHSNGYNIASALQRLVALKIVVANRPV